MIEKKLADKYNANLEDVKTLVEMFLLNLSQHLERNPKIYFKKEKLRIISRENDKNIKY